MKKEVMDMVGTRDYIRCVPESSRKLKVDGKGKKRLRAGLYVHWP
jgi:hypothetical protein